MARWHDETIGPWRSVDDIRTNIIIPNGIMTIRPHVSLETPDGKVWLFEWHSYLGPTFLRKDGEPRARYPGEKNPMWEAFNAWMDQGRRIDADGCCIWREESDAPGR